MSSSFLCLLYFVGFTTNMRLSLTPHPVDHSWCAERHLFNPGEVGRVTQVGVQAGVVLVATAVTSRHYARQHEVPTGVLGY